jgi:hypothetical protein
MLTNSCCCSYCRPQDNGTSRRDLQGILIPAVGAERNWNFALSVKNEEPSVMAQQNNRPSFEAFAATTEQLETTLNRV